MDATVTLFLPSARVFPVLKLVDTRNTVYIIVLCRDPYSLTILYYEVCFIATIPGWPSCPNSRTRSRSSPGIAILVPRSIKSPNAHSSDLTGKYSLKLISNHRPVFRHFRISLNTSSFFDARSISSLLIAIGTDSSTILRRYSSVSDVSLVFPVSDNKRDNESAIFFAPGMCLNYT